MAKTKTAYVCDACGADHTKWQGQCSVCGDWNTLKQFVIPKSSSAPVGPGMLGSTDGYSGNAPSVESLANIRMEGDSRTLTGFSELDRVLGGGLVPGSVVLIGGDPGAGKSTLLLQVTTQLSKQVSCLYVSGEESLQQIAQRASRLNLPVGDLRLATLTYVEQIAELVQKEKPSVVVVDSIQVMQVGNVDSVPGSVSQVRESAAFLTKLAKQTGTAMVLVGHVTKEGNLAGPKVLEHMIDCFLMLDSAAGSRFRTLRSLKNRFGAVNESGVFAITEQGMREVKNPSAIFLERPENTNPGSVVTVV